MNKSFDIYNNGFIWLLAPENVGIDTKIIVLGQVACKISAIENFMMAILKMAKFENVPQGQLW